MKRLMRGFIELLDDTLAYLMTVVGIIFSAYYPSSHSGELIPFNFDFRRILLSAIIAFSIVGKQEYLEIDKDGTRTRARAGRRKRIVLRMSNALAHGFMWTQMTGRIP